jgi:hypothetical protein
VGLHHRRWCRHLGVTFIVVSMLGSGRAGLHGLAITIGSNGSTLVVIATLDITSSSW